MTIYVGNLSYQVTEEDLKRAFAEYGTVSRVQLPTDRETGRPRGFAFVEMGSEAEEAKAIEALDGAEWMGRDLRVNKAKPKEDRGSGSPRGGGGSWGNRGGGGDRDRSSGGGNRGDRY
jgi:RNA recognition motif-containing protein